MTNARVTTVPAVVKTEDTERVAHRLLEYVQLYIHTGSGMVFDERNLASQRLWFVTAQPDRTHGTELSNSHL